MSYNNILRFVTKVQRIDRRQIFNPRLATTLSTSYMSTNTNDVQKEKEALKELLPNIINTIVNNTKVSEEIECSQWARKLMEYGLTGGKTSRGVITVFTYKAIANPKEVTAETMMKARIAGWCTEMVHSYILILDDMMDGSSTRRGKPCWYTLPDVGMGALKDVMMIHGSLFEILKLNFGKSPLYYNMMELFNEAILCTGMGEHLDNRMSKRSKDDYSLFTPEQYFSIAKFKAAYYSFKLPVLLGYLLANNTDKELHRKVEDICLDMGKIYQVQNDMLDCYGDEAETGKKGNDIQEGKCTWLSVNALRLCSAAQRAEFVHNYAHSDPARVHAVKRLYKELNLLQLYSEEEKSLYESIREKTNELPPNDRKLMHKLLDMIYKRKK